MISLDDAGNKTGETTGKFTVASAPPLVISGVEDEAGTLNTNFQTNDGNPTFVGTTSANGKIQLDIEGGTYTATADNTGAWKVTVNNAIVASASINYTITATNVAGAQSTKSGQIAIDVGAPTNLTGGLSADSLVTGTTNVTLSQSPTFSGTTIPSGVVSLTLNSVTTKATANAAGEWSITHPNADLTDGSHAYSISVMDSFGNSIETPLTGDIIVDAVKPETTVALSATTDTGIVGDNITMNTQPTLVGQTEVGASVVIEVGGSQYPATVLPDGAWHFTFPSALSEGENTISLLVTDQYGLSNTIQTTFTVTTTLPDAPSVTVEDSRDGVYISDSTPSFSGTTVANGIITFVINGRTFTTTAGEDGQWQFELPNYAALPTGTYQYQVTSTSPSGAKSQVTAGNVISDPTHCKTCSGFKQW